MDKGPWKGPYGSMIVFGVLAGMYAAFLFARSQPGFGTIIAIGASMLMILGVCGLKRGYRNRGDR
jgi:hypothetical protein